MTEITDAGGTIQKVEFELHDSTCRSLHDAALTAATERTRKKASRIASVEGLEIEEVKKVTSVDVTGGEDNGLGGLFASVIGDYEASLIPKPIEVAGTVKLVYGLNEA